MMLLEGLVAIARRPVKPFAVAVARGKKVRTNSWVQKLTHKKEQVALGLLQQQNWPLGGARKQRNRATTECCAGLPPTHREGANP